MPRATNRNLLPLIVIASACGLVAFGVLGLWQRARDAEERVRVEVRRATAATARALRRFVLEPAALEAVAPADRFAVVDHALAVPAGVGAVDPPPEAPADALPGDARAAHAAVERALLDGDDAAAATALDAVLARPDVPAGPRSWLVLRRGWLAHRLGDAARRDAALDELAFGAEGPAGEPPRAVVAGALLLAAEAGRALPAWALDRLPRLDDEQLAGVVDRLVERGAAGDELRRRAAELRRKRHVLRAVAPVLSSLLERGTPLALAHGDELLLFRPGPDDGSADGALVEPGAWLAALEARAEDVLGVHWHGVPRTGPEADLGEVLDAEPVVPGLCALVPDPAAAAAIGPPVLLWLLAVLGATFVAGLVATLRAQRREAAAVAVRADFLTSVTHELKTPLASIRLLAERLVRERVAPARLGEYHGLLAGEAGRLAVLIDNVLDLGRMERGERAYDRRPCALDGAVEDAVAAIAPLAQRDGVRVECALRAGDATAAVDRGALIQAVVNVLDNARKYAAAGERIDVGTELAGDRWLLRVRDRGPGVPAAERESIFERFRRGGAQRDGSVPGVGLGLYLARSIARAHGGELCCEDTAGPGATFRLELPVGAAGGEGSAAAAPRS